MLSTLKFDFVQTVFARFQFCQRCLIATRTAQTTSVLRATNCCQRCLNFASGSVFRFQFSVFSFPLERIAYCKMPCKAVLEWVEVEISAALGLVGGMQAKSEVNACHKESEVVSDAESGI